MRQAAVFTVDEVNKLLIEAWNTSGRTFIAEKPVLSFNLIEKLVTVSWIEAPVKAQPLPSKENQE